jgi:hypothetical protein
MSNPIDGRLPKEYEDIIRELTIDYNLHKCVSCGSENILNSLEVPEQNIIKSYVCYFIQLCIDENVARKVKVELNNTDYQVIYKGYDLHGDDVKLYKNMMIAIFNKVQHILKNSKYSNSVELTKQFISGGLDANKN